MSGIFPGGGCSKDNAINTVSNPLLKDGCTALYHCPRCTPRFDPSAANAVISEILNLMKCNEVEYDCDKLNNLCSALAIHEISGRQTFMFDETETPIELPKGTNRRIGGGSFTVPNTFHRPIRIFMEFESTIQFQLIGGDATSAIDIDLQVDDKSDFSGATIFLFSERVREWNAAGGDIQFAANPTSARGGVVIPPGGREFFWRARITDNSPGQWYLQYTADAFSVTVYGTSSHERDIF